MKKFYLLGENISYSLSPKIHSLIYAHLGIDAQYSLYSCAKESLDTAIEHMRICGGFNVTQPHKENIINYLDGVHTPLKAVNTVKVKNGRLYGYNTDYDGLMFALKNSGESFCGKNVLIQGAGGMARVAAAVLKALNANVYIQNRTLSKAVSLAEEMNVKVFPQNNNIDIRALINCSSQGLKNEAYILPEGNFEKLTYAFDSIYFETEFFKAMSGRNIKTENGLSMLIYQAIAAEEIFLDITLQDCEKTELFSKIKGTLKNENFSN